MDAIAHECTSSTSISGCLPSTLGWAPYPNLDARSTESEIFDQVWGSRQILLNFIQSCLLEEYNHLCSSLKQPANPHLAPCIHNPNVSAVFPQNQSTRKFITAAPLCFYTASGQVYLSLHALALLHIDLPSTNFLLPCISRQSGCRVQI